MVGQKEPQGECEDDRKERVGERPSKNPEERAGDLRVGHQVEKVPPPDEDREPREEGLSLRGGEEALHRPIPGARKQIHHDILFRVVAVAALKGGEFL